MLANRYLDYVLPFSWSAACPYRFSYYLFSTKGQRGFFNVCKTSNFAGESAIHLRLWLLSDGVKLSAISGDQMPSFLSLDLCLRPKFSDEWSYCNMAKEQQTQQYRLLTIC